MAKTRKARSKKTKNHLRKTRTIQKLIVKFGKCSKRCMRFGYGTKSYKKCLNKNCRKTLTKLLKQVKKNKKIRGGYGPGGCPVGAPWNPTTGGNHYALSKLGGAAGGLSPYSGMNSPSPQRGGTFTMQGDPLGGGMVQQLVTNPVRGLMGGLENLHNKYAGKALSPSPWPTAQSKFHNEGGTKNTTYDIPK